MSRPSTISAWASRFSRRKSSPWVVDEGLLRSLVPLNLLGPAELRALVDQARVVKLDGGRQMERDPSAGPATGYLLSGIVEVMEEGESPIPVAAGTDAARRPLWDGKRGAVTLCAKTDVTVLELDAAADELAMAGSTDTGDYEVSDIRSATATDWLTRFLQAKVFTRLPLNNIRELLARMEEIEVDAGQPIMRQGEADGYYYIVKRGACRVTTRGEGGEIELARLGEGDGFGEDALITDGRRSATVTMVAEGSLMRLAKQDFTSLLVEPVLQYVDAGRALEMQADGALILDVRKPEEYARDGLAEALNIPLNMLRTRRADLDSGKAYVAVSNVLNRSTAAAFFLCQHGLEAYILKDGVKALSAVMPPAASPAPVAAPARQAPVLSLISGSAPDAAGPAAPAPQAPAPQVVPAAAAAAAVVEDDRSIELRTANDRLAGELQVTQEELAREQERSRGLAERLEAGEVLGRRSEELASLNDDLLRRNDELSRRSEELARHQEELVRRAEETTRRGEELARELAARDAALAEAGANRAQHDAEREVLAARLGAAEREIDRLEDERARHAEAAAALEAVRDELERATARNGETERRLELQSQELERLRQALAAGESAEAEVAELQSRLVAERDAAAGELEKQRQRAAEAARALAAQSQELQRMHDAEAKAASIRADCDALEQRLQAEAERRQEAAKCIAELERRLAQADTQQSETETLRAEAARLDEALARERRDRRTFERELALQTVELQRLRRSRDEDDGEQAARIAAVQAELDEQRRRLAEVQAREAAQAKQLQEFMRQGQRLRSRLKKVCTLARDMERRRRAAEQAVAQQGVETKALKQQVYERSLRLAELELVRRKLEQDNAALRPAKQPQPQPQPQPERVAVQPAPAAVLRLPSPDDRSPPAEHGSRLTIAGRRAIQLTVLIAATLICVYGLLATGILKAHAADWPSRIMEMAGLLGTR